LSGGAADLTRSAPDAPSPLEIPAAQRRGDSLTRLAAIRWTTSIPVLAAVALALTWGRKPGTPVLVVDALLLGGAVLAAVHHAEVVAHRVGEPFGSLILAVAVTVIEVGLIVTLMISGGGETSTLARDTVFAAVMITCNGVVGIALLVGSLREHVVPFRAEGTAAALATVATLATLTLVLPTFTTSTPGPEFSSEQLAFASVASLALYLLFVFVQTVRHRDYFLPDTPERADPHADLDPDVHAAPPSERAALVSLAVLMVALVAVVGLAKIESKPIEHAVDAVGAPQSAVGVVIALLVLMPETLAAYRNAARGRVQISLNLAYGSAMASIGLTIPTIAIASIWLDPPLVLGLGPTQIVLLAITVVVGALSVPLGRATVLQSGIRLVLFAAFVFLSIFP
jgi:Ca2+:H+ antiporter